MILPLYAARSVRRAFEGRCLHSEAGSVYVLCGFLFVASKLVAECYGEALRVAPYIHVEMLAAVA